MLKPTLIATTFSLLAAAGAQAATVSFQDGLNGYEGNLSRVLAKGAANGTPTGFASTATLDLQTNRYPRNAETQWLLRFDDLFGALGVPAGATINSASLRLFTKDSTVGTVSAHQMLTNWDRTSSWNSLNGGINPGVDAVALADDALTGLADEAYAVFDVTSSVTAWANGAANFGWAFLIDSLDNWDVQTDMYRNAAPALLAARRPLLSIDFTPAATTSPVPLPAAVWLLGAAMCGLGAVARRQTAA
jgi:hypothetical protein